MWQSYMNEDDDFESLSLLTVKEAATLLRISSSLVYGLIESGRLPASRLGKGRGAIRIKKSDVAAYVEENRIQKPSEAASVRPRRREKLKHIKL